MRKLIMLTISLLLVLCLVACTKKEEPKPVEPPVEEPTEQPQQMLGAWEYLGEEEMTPELQEIFDKANEASEEKYEAHALEAKQVVSGMNYRFLAKRLSDEKKVELTIYQDLEGNCSITDVVEIEEQLMGGWTQAEDGTLTDELKEIWDKANANGELANLEPVELLSTQVVAGTNYKFLAKDLESTTEPVSLKEVTIYLDLQGNASLLEMAEYIAEDTLA